MGAYKDMPKNCPADSRGARSATHSQMNVSILVRYLVNEASIVASVQEFAYLTITQSGTTLEVPVCIYKVASSSTPLSVVRVQNLRRT